jgi:hypothetical protein
MKIWKYTPDSDHFQSLALVDHKQDGYLFHEDNFKSGMPFPEPLPKISVMYEKEWKDLSPTQCKLAQQGQLPRGDFPSLYGTELIFSERALEFLSPLIQNSTQIIPLQSNEDQLYLIHVTNFVDCLDRNNSKIKWLTGYENRIIFQVNHYEFHDEKLRSQTIFKMPELFTSTFVSDTFKNAVEEHGLRGLQWMPLP